MVADDHRLSASLPQLITWFDDLLRSVIFDHRKAKRPREMHQDGNLCQLFENESDNNRTSGFYPKKLVLIKI